MPDQTTPTPNIPTPPSAAPLPSEADIEIQTIPDQFYGTALKAKAPVPAPVKKAAPSTPEAEPPHPSEGMPKWVLPVAAGVVLLLMVGGGFWYFNPDLFAPKPAPAPIVQTPEPEPEPEPQPPQAPTNVQATSTEGGSVRITWEDLSDNEAGFRVERRIATSTTVSFEPVTSLPPNTTLFLDPTTMWETTYAYRVIAVNQDGETPSASETTITLPENPQKPMEVVELPPAGLDTDSDGLTDMEEPLYGSPPRDPDADKDTFLDGNEVFHLYTPSGKAPGLLLDSGLVRKVESTVGWSVYVPVTWQTTMEQQGNQATILTGHGEQFRIRVENRTAGNSVLDWYLAQHPGILSSQVKQVMTKGGLEGIVSADELTAYFPWGSDKVLVFEYRLEGQPFVNFRTTYEMMKNSLALGPFQSATPSAPPAAEAAAEQVTEPATEESSQADVSSEAPTASTSTTP